MTALSDCTSYDIVAMFNDDHANGDSGTVNIMSFYHPIIPRSILPARPKIFNMVNVGSPHRRRITF